MSFSVIHLLGHCLPILYMFLPAKCSIWLDFIWSSQTIWAVFQNHAVLFLSPKTGASVSAVLWTPFNCPLHPVIQAANKHMNSLGPLGWTANHWHLPRVQLFTHQNRIPFLSIFVSYGELCQKSECATLAASFLFPGASPCRGEMRLVWHDLRMTDPC